MGDGDFLLHRVVSMPTGAQTESSYERREHSGLARPTLRLMPRVALAHDPILGALGPDILDAAIPVDTSRIIILERQRRHPHRHRTLRSTALCRYWQCVQI